MAWDALPRTFGSALMSGLGALCVHLVGGDAGEVAAAAALGALLGHWDLGPRPVDADPGPGALPAAPDAVPPPGLPPGVGRLLLEHLPMGVLLIDADGHLQFINSVAADLFGRRPPGNHHISALRVPALLDAVDLALTDARPNVVEFTLSRGAETHLRAYIRPLDEPLSFDGNSINAAVLVGIEDHSQVRRAEELHRDFVANASHELKTPLASISAIIETLQGHARGDVEAEQRFLTMMAVQTHRMKRLVEDLLSLNRIELNERVHPSVPQPIARIVWEVADSQLPHAEAAGITLAVDPPGDFPTVPGNREELSQLFVNLIDNAIKYGLPDTVVRVALHRGQRPGMVGVSVTDRGRGIAREHIPRLTERFYRVSISRSREKGGTGLGLAIVKHIVSRHRGELTIESELGVGSRFTVWLPVLVEGPAPAVPEPQQAAGRG